jgi:hypothetical protein
MTQAIPFAFEKAMLSWLARVAGSRSSSRGKEERAVKNSLSMVPRLTKTE